MLKINALSPGASICFWILVKYGVRCLLFSYEFWTDCNHCNPEQSILLVRGDLMTRTKVLAFLSVLVAVVVVSWVGLSATSNSVIANMIETTEELGAGPLDGKMFTGELGLSGKPKDIKDSFVFANGTFISKECEFRCKYPASPYFARTRGSVTEFVSESRCPYKDAKIVWRGTIQDGIIKGVSTWTIKRWYWTIEDRFEFEGRLITQAAPVASAE